MPNGTFYDLHHRPYIDYIAAIANPCMGDISGLPPLTGCTADANRTGVAGFHCAGGIGARGVSARGIGVAGESDSGVGVRGISASGIGVIGESDHREGVRGETNSTRFAAVAGVARSRVVDPSGGASTGVWGSSVVGEGVHGETRSEKFAAIAGIHLNEGSGAPAIYGEHKGDGPAAFFNGNVVVTKDIVLLNADCAEEFDVAGQDDVEPGTVMVIDTNGALERSCTAYDKRVAGIISGAGDCRPALILDRKGEGSNRRPVALVGKVFCKVDAQYAAIEVGDLLTSSPTPGHAMKASDPFRAFGAVLGKALRPHAEGRGLIPVLVALQ